MASTLSDALLRSLGRSGTCRDLAREIVPPRIPSAKNAWTAGTDTWRDRSSLGAVARPVWVMMPFGSDLRMLQLHLATLADVTTGFLVTESTFTFTRHRSKPALATEALKNGTFPPEIAAKMEVRVVDLQAAMRRGHCSGRTAGYDRTACAEDWQRYALFDMLLRRASATDVAILADADEIARPHVVALLARCYPFVEGSDEGSVGKYILQAAHYEYGLHCRRALRWDHGPQAYSAGYMIRRFRSKQQRDADGAVPKERSQAAAFSSLRGEGAFRIPAWRDAALHLSSFGPPADIRAKFRSWGHANTFLTPNQQQWLKGRASALDHAGSGAGGSDAHARSGRSGVAAVAWRLRGGFAAPNATEPAAVGFVKNGYEHAALSVGRIGRCARLCLSPYPTPMFASGKPQTVPPCLAAQQATKGGRVGVDRPVGTLLRERPSQSPSAMVRADDAALAAMKATQRRQGGSKASLPAAFFAPQFEQLLFGYF